MSFCARRSSARRGSNGSPTGRHQKPLLAQHDDPVAEVVGLDQPQQDLRVRRPEHRRATPDHHGVDVEPVLVDRVVAGELRGRVGAAEEEVSTGLCFENEHLGRHDVVEDRRVPVGPLQGARVDDLRHVPPIRANSTTVCGGRVPLGHGTHGFAHGRSLLIRSWGPGSFGAKITLRPRPGRRWAHLRPWRSGRYSPASASGSRSTSKVP